MTTHIMFGRAQVRSLLLVLNFVIVAYGCNPCAGFSSEVDKLLLKATTTESNNEWEKYVVIVMDEMYLREDLVYDKHSGALIGFANIGDTNQQLLKFEKLAQGEEEIENASLAKTMLVFMVRGLFSSLQFPYVQFPFAKVYGEFLFDPFWEAVRRLEFIGLKVVAATADGAATNRRFVKIHKNRCKRGEIVYKVANPFAGDEGRQLYFFSDPPHLIKTVRNAWSNAKRHLWVSVTIDYCATCKIIFLLINLSAMVVISSGAI